MFGVEAAEEVAGAPLVGVEEEVASVTYSAESNGSAILSRKWKNRIIGQR